MSRDAGNSSPSPAPGSAAEIWGPLRMPKDTPTQRPARFQRLTERAKEAWDKKPDALEFHFIYVPFYLPIAVAAGALAVGVLDGTLHTHIAERMAKVHVDKKDGAIERNIEKAIHGLGVEALKGEK